MKSLKKYRSAENRSLLCMCWSVDKRSLMHWGGPMRGSNGRASCSARMHGNGFEVWMRCALRASQSHWRGEFAYRVVIQSFTAEYERETQLRYRIVCEVLEDT